MSISRNRGAIPLTDVEPITELLKSLANPQRLMIVCTLIEGERAVSELERDLDIRQPSLSQHLASLREAGLVIGRRSAKAVYYRISDSRAARVVDALHEIFCPQEVGTSLREPENPRAMHRVQRAHPLSASARSATRHGEAAVFAVITPTGS